MPRLLILLSALCFATTGTAQALGAPGASPVTVGEARIAVGALGLHLIAAAAARHRRPPGTIRRGSRRPLPWTPALWAGALGVAGYQVSFFLAVRITGVAVGTVVALGSAPVVTGLLAAVCGQGRPGRRWGVATGLAGAGLTVLTLSGTRAHVHPAGLALAVVAAASFATYAIAVKAALDAGEPGDEVLAAVFTGGALALSPALVLLPLGWLATPRGATAALWLGVVPTALAYHLFARGLRHVSAAEASTLTLAEPLTAATLGVLALGEPCTPASLAGGLLLVAGLAVLGAGGRGRREPRPAPTPAGAAVPATGRMSG